MPSSFVLSTETLPSFGPLNAVDRMGLTDRSPAKMPTSKSAPASLFWQAGRACAELHAGGTGQELEELKVAECVDGFRSLVGRPQHDDATEVWRAALQQPRPQQDAAHRVSDEMHPIDFAASGDRFADMANQPLDRSNGRGIGFADDVEVESRQRLLHDGEGRVRPSQPVKQDDAVPCERGRPKEEEEQHSETHAEQLA